MIPTSDDVRRIMADIGCTELQAVRHWQSRAELARRKRRIRDARPC